MEELVKIKQEKEEKPLIKSSNEILSELFSTFNAKPPEIDDTLKSMKKHKKSKKKHKKHKHKKHKKHLSSPDHSNSELEKKRYKKKKKRKHNDSSSDDSSDSDNSDTSSSESSDDEQRSTDKEKVANTLYNVLSEGIRSSLFAKAKVDEKKESRVVEDDEKSRIKIKNLTAVFEATLKERQKRKLDEENESNDSDADIENNKHFKHDKRHHDSTTSKETTSSKSKHQDQEEKRWRSKRSRSRHKSPHRHRHHHHHRDKSPITKNVKERLGYPPRSSDYYPKYNHSSYSHYRSKSWDRKRSSRSPSRHFDKKKLLEIARKNAIHMLKNGSLPGAAGLGPQAQEKVLAAIKAGGKSIEELTEFCKNLSKREALGELSDNAGDDADDDIKSDDEDETKPFNHPFQLKERPLGIIMNIPNSTPIPIKTAAEKSMDKTALLMQFPVSSGTLHRRTESEWVPVEPKKVETTSTTSLMVVPPQSLQQKSKRLNQMQNKQFVNSETKYNNEKCAEISPPLPVTTQLPAPGPQVMPLLPPPLPPMLPDSTTSDNFTPNQNVFPTITKHDINKDIGAIVSQRLAAMRRLQENPNDTQAIKAMYNAQQEMQNWAASKQIPGQFTGSTGANILSAAELSSGYQAWARKDQLQTATPLSGGMGMHLLQKMGWKPGEGLGKDKSGTLQPLLLEVKLDKRGLVADEEGKTPKNFRKNKFLGKVNNNTCKTLEGKHPVSLLGEFATKRKLGFPQYECIFECGPSHKKNFLFKVRLNGMEYQPSIASASKKQAKADAAKFALQQLGVFT